jgi:hypothetical protein
MKHTRNPEQEFGSPMQLVESDGLTDTEKMTILKSWQMDLIELQRAEEENMPNDSDDPGDTARKLAAVTAAIEAMPKAQPIDKPDSRQPDGAVD